MFGYIFPTVQTYTVAKFQSGRAIMDYKKEIIELIEGCENEGKLKFVYTILINYLKSKKQGD